MKVATGLFAALVGIALMCSAMAQDITKGSIAGVIRDPSGAVMAGATVRLTSPYGDRTAKTDSLVEYNFTNLVVGS